MAAFEAEAKAALKLMNKYYDTMNSNTPGLNNDERSKIFNASIQIESIIICIQNLKSTRSRMTPLETTAMQQFQVLKKLSPYIELNNFPPISLNVLQVPSLVQPPNAPTIKELKHDVETSPESRIIRDRNNVEDRKRKGLVTKQCPPFLETFIDVIRLLLPLHTIDAFTAIVSKPGKNNQALHTDYKGISPLASPTEMPYWIFIACQNETFLWYMNDLHEKTRLQVSAGDCVFGAGNAIHSGSAYETENLRFHVYIDSHKHKHDSRSQDFAQYASLPQPPVEFPLKVIKTKAEVPASTSLKRNKLPTKPPAPTVVVPMKAVSVRVSVSGLMHPPRVETLLAKVPNDFLIDESHGTSEPSSKKQRKCPPESTETTPAVRTTKKLSTKVDPSITPAAKRLLSKEENKTTAAPLRPLVTAPLASLRWKTLREGLTRWEAIALTKGYTLESEQRPRGFGCRITRCAGHEDCAHRMQIRLPNPEDTTKYCVEERGVHDSRCAAMRP